MAAKKTTKKKTAKKKAALDLHTPFTTGEIDEPTANAYAEHLRHMENTVGWQIVQKVIGNNLHQLEQAIVYKLDPETGARMSDEDTDELRIMHAQLKQLVELPGMLARSLDSDSLEGAAPDEFDPYRKSWEPQVYGNDANVLSDT